MRIALISLAAAFSWLAVGHVERLCRGLGLAAAGRPERWRLDPTPRLGGLGFAPVFLLGSALFEADAGLLLGGALMAMTGLVDDLRGLPPMAKLAGQVLAAGAGLALAGPAGPGEAAVRLAWLVAVPNALNMLDNMDGLAAGAAVVAALWLAALAPTNERGPCLLLAAATFGFWLRNRPRATIFMGDTGSLFLGFALAWLGLRVFADPGGEATVQTYGLAGLVLCAPLADGLATVVSRLWRGRRPWLGGADHGSHRLARRGWRETWVMAMFCGVGLAGGAIALAIRLSPGAAAWIAGSFCLGLGLWETWLHASRSGSHG